MRAIDSFAAAVHRKRRERGLTLGEVATKAGYSASYLSKLLHGHRTLLPAVVHDLDTALAADGELDKIAAAQRGDGRPVARPVQLPAAPADFVGREEQLQAMDHALVTQGRPGATATIVIEGGFWTGKTALAVHWAAGVQARFPGGCLFADLRGLAPGVPADPEEVLDGFLLALGVSPAELGTSSLQARVARYRSLLAERPAVVLLDNVADYQQAEWLLPGAGSVVLATSRERQSGLLARTGGTVIELPSLTAEQALELLGRRIGEARVRASAAAAELVVERCGRLPMTVLVAAEHLQRHRETSLTELAERLDSEKTRLDLFTSNDPAVNIHGVIDVSYLALPAMVRRVFRYLGIGPANVIGPEAAAVLADLEVERAEQALRILAEAHLLESLPDGRYRISFLLRAYAHQRALVEEKLSEVERAHDRTLRWYAATAWEANNTLIPNWADSGLTPTNLSGVEPLSFEAGGFESAMAWCEREVSTALQIARNARTYGAKDILWQLPTAFLPYFVLTRSWNTWLVAAHDGLAAARAADSEAGIARSLEALGWVEHELGQTDEGILHLEEALGRHVELGDDRSRAWTAYGLGLAYVSCGLTDESREAHELADRLFADSGTKIGLAVNRAALAGACDLVGQADKAMEYALDALNRAQTFTSKAVLGIAHQRIGALLSRHGHHRSALKHFDEALAVRGRSWQRWGAAETLISRAEALHQLGQIEQARETYLQSLEILDAIRDVRALEVRTRLASLEARSVGSAGWPRKTSATA
ncbi:helix-turn-helix domain-containing protein [Amycolatopsis sp. Hca4]|uniref:helix-turn-helix domain-containing protein n=1 Tax=Amycolatopsis sp. Hca4 TaxID=2742131 RepID=UPI0015911C46|nr:helix-turn-helix domain-containing protein [Amycolatopsis sp. Hca4]QKV80702.1 helix-turn-helix domain-containing protein [Amycolatopsis sp. Hca4]